MRSYVAVLALRDYDGLKQRAGYIAASSVLDQAAEAVRSINPRVAWSRAGRCAAEFSFSCSSADAALTLLLQLRRDLIVLLGRNPQLHDPDVTIAAVPAVGDRVTEACVLRAERLLGTMAAQRSPVLVAEADVALDQDQRLARDLYAAMRDGGLELHYQPKLRSRSTEIAGAEALLRWTHPELGPLAPDLFIPAMERSDGMRSLTHWVIDRAIEDQKRMQALGIHLPTHVNISAPLVADRAFAERALDQLGGFAGTIGFEITESAMIADPEGALANLERLAAAGVRLAIDDYGTGFSSLAYLQRMPVHELKIDKRFVSALSTSARDPLLVRSTIELAHALEMEVTAEGIETAASLALLQVMRCDLLQGYFLSPPLPLEQFISFARDSQEGAIARPQVASLRERLAQKRAQRRSDA